MGLEFQAYGTAVPSLRDWSFIPTGLKSLPQETTPHALKDGPGVTHLSFTAKK